MTDHHNIESAPDWDGIPAPTDATAADLGRVVERLGALAMELSAPVVTEELRLIQYRRAAEYARWITAAGDDLANALTRWTTGHGESEGGVSVQ